LKERQRRFDFWPRGTCFSSVNSNGSEWGKSICDCSRGLKRRVRSLSTGGGAKRCLGEEKREGTGARAIRRRRRRRENRRPAPTTNKRFCVCSLSLFLSLFRTHRRRGARGSHAHVDGGAHVVDSSSLDGKRLRRSREKGRKGERRVFFLFVVDFFCGSKSEEKKTKLRTFVFF